MFTPPWEEKFSRRSLLGGSKWPKYEQVGKRKIQGPAGRLSGLGREKITVTNLRTERKTALIPVVKLGKIEMKKIKKKTSD